jgi:AraC family transcriptional regulator
MEWSERMNTAIDYIEDNLAYEIDINEAAGKACCSLYHFQRMFFAIIGVTPAEYTRRRRLTLAATELTMNNIKVIDLAVKYGYDSPDSFTRAFRNVHGITPRAARAPGVKLTAFPRVSFNLKLNGGTNVDYRIMEKPAFEVIGKSRVFSNVNGQDMEKCPQFWDEFRKDKGLETLDKLTGGKTGPVTGGSYLGVCQMFEGSTEDFTYAITAEKSGVKAPAGFEVIKIPASTWAVFDSIGPMPKAIQDVSGKIFHEWFPSTGYEHAATPELEVYLPGNFGDKKYHCQVWVPVNRKKK